MTATAEREILATVIAAPHRLRELDGITADHWSVPEHALISDLLHGLGSWTTDALIDAVTATPEISTGYVLDLLGGSRLQSIAVELEALWVTARRRGACRRAREILATGGEWGGPVIRAVRLPVLVDGEHEYAVIRPREVAWLRSEGAATLVRAGGETIAVMIPLDEVCRLLRFTGGA